MNGILCIDKPQDFTSFDIVAVSRRLCGTKKIGHTGTLDPMATGVLVLLINRAAKTLQFLPSHNKSYSASFKLGFFSDTGDIWGNVKETGCNLSISQIEHELKERVLKLFTGDIMQTPPMYSAVKIGGKRLYDLAREGKTVERPARPVTIDRLELTGIDRQSGEFYIDCTCSSGTYIRSLITDIGQALDTQAVMTGLRRTMCCGYTLDDCITLDKAREYAETGELERFIRPTDSVFLQNGAKKLFLSTKQKAMFQNGVRLQLSRFDGDFMHNDIVCVYGKADEFVGLGRCDLEKDYLRQAYLNEVI